MFFLYLFINLSTDRPTEYRAGDRPVYPYTKAPCNYVDIPVGGQRGDQQSYERVGWRSKGRPGRGQGRRAAQSRSQQDQEQTDGAVEAHGRRTGGGRGRRKAAHEAGQDRTNRKLLSAGQRAVCQVSPIYYVSMAILIEFSGVLVVSFPSPPPPSVRFEGDFSVSRVGLVGVRRYWFVVVDFNCKTYIIV